MIKHLVPGFFSKHSISRFCKEIWVLQRTVYLDRFSPTCFSEKLYKEESPGQGFLVSAKRNGYLVLNQNFGEFTTIPSAWQYVGLLFHKLVIQPTQHCWGRGWS